MIHFMSLIRPAGQPTAAPQSAGTAPAGGGQPVNLFAALIQKLLGDLGGGASVAASSATIAEEPLPCPPKSVVKSDAKDPAADDDPRVVKTGPKENPGDTVMPAVVQQPDLMVALNLVTPPAGAAGLPPASAAAGVSVPGAGAPENSSPAGGILTGGSPVSSGAQVSFSQQYNPPQPGTGMFVSFFNDVSTFGARVPLPPGSPVRSLVPGRGVVMQQEQVSDQTMTPDLAVQTEKTLSAGLAFQSDQSAALPPLTESVTPPSAGSPLPAAANPAVTIATGLKSGEAYPADLSVPGTSPAASEPPQVQSPALTAPAIPLLQVVSPGIPDPSIFPRIGIAQQRNSVDPNLRRSGDGVDTDSASQSDEAPPARSGFFTSVVNNVLDIFSRDGSKSASPDPQGGLPSPAPPVKFNAAPGDPSPVFADVQQQPVKKTADGPVQDSGAASASDVARPARGEIDLTALRTSQVAQVSQAVSDRPDPAGAAPALRDVPSPYAPLPAEVSRRIADQVVQNLKLQVDGTTSDIRMTLKPPSLGDVQLSVHVEDSRMQAQINVTQQVVKTALEAHMPQLRQALQDHGIEVQRIDVVLPEASLQHDGAGANGERTGRRGGRRVLAADDTEEYREAKDMGYNTIELLM